MIVMRKLVLLKVISERKTMSGESCVCVCVWVGRLEKGRRASTSPRHLRLSRENR